jgi:hypothetical protein
LFSIVELFYDLLMPLICSGLKSIMLLSFHLKWHAAAAHHSTLVCPYLHTYTLIFTHVYTQQTQEARRYADVDETDNESEGGPTPSTQGGGIFGLFKGSTPQNKQQPAAAKRLKVKEAKPGLVRKTCDHILRHCHATKKESLLWHVHVPL